MSRVSEAEELKADPWVIVSVSGRNPKNSPGYYLHPSHGVPPHSLPTMSNRVALPELEAAPGSRVLRLQGGQGSGVLGHAFPARL